MVQAISVAVDRDECIKTAAVGYAVLTAPCTPPMKQWQLPEAQWQPYYKVDLERAKALLAQAGYPNGFEATCLTISSFPALFANAQVIQANLKRIGISLKVESVDYAPWVQRWQKKDFDLTLNTTSRLRRSRRRRSTGRSTPGPRTGTASPTRSWIACSTRDGPSSRSRSASRSTTGSS